MPAIVRGGGGGKNTKDATAVPGDVKKGKIFYGRNGREVGINDAKEVKTVSMSIKKTELLNPEGYDKSKIQETLKSNFVSIRNFDSYMVDTEHIELKEGSTQLAMGYYGTSSAAYAFKKNIISLPKPVDYFWIEFRTTNMRESALIVPCKAVINGSWLPIMGTLTDNSYMEMYFMNEDGSSSSYKIYFFFGEQDYGKKLTFGIGTWDFMYDEETKFHLPEDFEITLNYVLKQ